MVGDFGGLLIWNCSSQRRLYSCLVFICFSPLLFISLPVPFSLSLAVFLLFVSLFPSNQTSARPLYTGQHRSSDLVGCVDVKVTQFLNDRADNRSSISHLTEFINQFCVTIKPMKKTQNKHPSCHPSVLFPSCFHWSLHLRREYYSLDDIYCDFIHCD